MIQREWIELIRALDDLCIGLDVEDLEAILTELENEVITKDKVLDFVRDNF